MRTRTFFRMPRPPAARNLNQGTKRLKRFLEVDAIRAIHFDFSYLYWTRRYGALEAMQTYTFYQYPCIYKHHRKLDQCKLWTCEKPRSVIGKMNEKENEYYNQALQKCAAFDVYMEKDEQKISLLYTLIENIRGHFIESTSASKSFFYKSKMKLGQNDVNTNVFVKVTWQRKGDGEDADKDAKINKDAEAEEKINKQLWDERTDDQVPPGKSGFFVQMYGACDLTHELAIEQPKLIQYIENGLLSSTKLTPENRTKYFEDWKNDEGVFKHFVMEDIDGIDFHEVLSTHKVKPKRITAVDVLKACVDIMRALSLLEKVKILHNDLHFGNIKLVANKDTTGQHLRYRVKIFDWDRGIAPGIAVRPLPRAHATEFVLGYDLIGFRNTLKTYRIFNSILAKAFPTHTAPSVYRYTKHPPNPCLTSDNGDKYYRSFKGDYPTNCLNSYEMNRRFVYYRIMNQMATCKSAIKVFENGLAQLKKDLPGPGSDVPVSNYFELRKLVFELKLEKKVIPRLQHITDMAHPLRFRGRAPRVSDSYRQNINEGLVSTPAPEVVELLPLLTMQMLSDLYIHYD